MAKKIITTITDDISGEEGAETVKFALDGVTYTIDLAEENREALYQALERFTAAAVVQHGSAAARRASSNSVQSRRSSREEREERQVIRQWWGENYEVAGLKKPGDRGRIPATVVAAFHAHQGRPVARAVPEAAFASA